MKHETKLSNLIYDLRYELAGGAHTFHMCKCEKYSTRRGKCAVCLVTEFKEEKKCKHK